MEESMQGFISLFERIPEDGRRIHEALDPGLGFRNVEIDPRNRRQAGGAQSNFEFLSLFKATQAESRLYLFILFNQPTHAQIIL